MQKSHRRTPCVIALTFFSAVLAGCGSSGGDNNPDSSITPAAVANTAPKISGSPADTTKIGNQYTFQPSASDADGDALTFSIQNTPAWASFDATTGKLSGTAQLADVGLYSGIVVSVIDGAISSSLPAFALEVVQNGNGSVTLSWTPPTTNTDGSALTDLAAYRFYYGVTIGDYPNQILIDNPGIATYVVTDLAPNTYFFVATAINSQGLESDFSNVAEKVVL